MRDILISTDRLRACLMVALFSQILAAHSVDASSSTLVADPIASTGGVPRQPSDSCRKTRSSSGGGHRP